MPQFSLVPPLQNAVCRAIAKKNLTHGAAKKNSLCYENKKISKNLSKYIKFSCFIIKACDDSIYIADILFFHDHPCGAGSNVCAILTCIVSTSLNDTKKGYHQLITHKITKQAVERM